MDEQNLTQKKRIEIESDYRDIETHGYRMDYDLKLEKDTDKIDKNQESFYTVSSAEEYNKKIKSVLEAMPESLPLGMRQKLTAKKNRNDAFILQNDRTWLGLGKDSPQMTAVKRQSKSLEFFLQEPFLTTNDLLNAENQIIAYYNDAIQACADYISSKRRRPLWPPYAARYDKVRALKLCYENELELLKNNLILLRSKDNDDFTRLRIFSPLDILTMNRFDADNIRVEKEFLRGHKQRPESEKEIAAKVESLKTASEQRKRVSGRDPMTFKLNNKAGRRIHEQYIKDRDNAKMLTYKDPYTINTYTSTNNMANVEIGDMAMDFQRNYVSFSSMNTALRKGVYRENSGKFYNCKVYEHQENIKETGHMLDILDRNTLSKDTITFRGTDLYGMFSFLNLPMDEIEKAQTEDEKEILIASYINDNMERLNSEHPVVGDKGFLSTTPFYHPIYGTSPAQFYIQARKGDKALYLDSIKRGSLEPEETSEYELCFQAGTKFKLLKIEPHKGSDGPIFDIYLETTGEVDRPV